MKKIYNISLLVLTVLSALLIGCAGENGADTVDGGKSTENSSMQEDTEKLTSENEKESSQIAFVGQDIDGNTVSSDVFSESKLTMVNVWATYCNPCLSEMPGLGELAGEYAPEEFRIIGIISDVPEDGDGELLSQAEALIEQTNANYTHLLLNKSVYSALLTDVTAVPTTFFVDENGVVLDTVVGAMEKAAWEEKVNGLLEER